MREFLFKNPSFIKTAILPKDYPVLRDKGGDLLPEIAVAGRSNVGKSSLLNHLFQRKDLVKTSSVPGKTQALNFFTLNDQIAFVDLPGYGYAQVPLSVSKKWGPMIQTYFEKRETLQLLLLLFDIRRTPNEEDKQLLEWATYMHLPVILVLTKTDKVKANEKNANTAEILRELHEFGLEHIHYSVVKNTGRNQLMSMIRAALEGSDGKSG